jgi:hypothetical protein
MKSGEVHKDELDRFWITRWKSVARGSVIGLFISFYD